ncbi:MAG: U32 family peptidase [Firmicutes bacterium]|nr:U32 family peptidase [Bacillota bacterium]
MTKNYRPEILSPAGTFSCFLSALGSGADAVYFGGQLFNARAGAGNFSKDEIRETVRLARLYGVRTHLTVNISVKEKEWESLKAFLHEILPLGIDAVIVQDPAVASYIGSHFPDVELHASTQMAVTNLDGVKWMEDLGFRRVVLARELSLAEIEYIRSRSDMQLELFIHGALCYSYSGRCLMSSFHGGRSGNRGQCAQPCRMPYVVQLGGDRSKTGHYLSLKDRSAFSVLNELMDLRIDSFKIEGRMKSEAYVSGVTRFYQELKNHYLQTGCIGKIEAAKLEEIMQLYNRGSFTDGYFRDKTQMIEPGDPKNHGIRIGKARVTGSSQIRIESDHPLHAGDELKIGFDGKAAEIRLAGSMIKDDHTAVLELKGISAGSRTAEVRRIVDPVLNERLVIEAMKLPSVELTVTGSLKEGEPSLWSACADGIQISLTGPVPEKAKMRPTDEETIRQQLGRLGGTPFVLSDCQIRMEDELFVPVSRLNELRRYIVRMMQEKLETRSFAKSSRGIFSEEIVLTENKEKNRDQGTKIQILVQSRPQLLKVLEKQASFGKAPDILLSLEGFLKADKEETLQRIEENGIGKEQIILQLPLTARDSQRQIVTEEMKRWMDAGIDYFEASLPGQVLWIRSLGAKVFTGPDMGIWNRLSGEILKRQTEGYCISRELSLKEIEELKSPEGAALTVYGRIPYMITEQCPVRECFGCRKNHDSYSLTDRKGEMIRGVCHCDLCYNVFYSEDPAVISKKSGYLQKVLMGRQKSPADILRVELTTETEKEIDDVFSFLLDEDQTAEIQMTELRLTEGHFRKEVM